eukprot:55077_1
MSTTPLGDTKSLLLQLENEWNAMSDKLLEQFLLQSVDVLDASQFANAMLYGFNNLDLSRDQLRKLLSIAETLRINDKLSQAQSHPNTNTSSADNDTEANTSTLHGLSSLLIYRTFSFLTLSELLNIELCCRSFRIDAHHPLSFNSTQCLHLFPSHFPFNFYRFKYCQNIAVHFNKDAMKKVSVHSEYRHQRQNKEWRWVFAQINTHFTNIQRIDIPVNFPAFEPLMDELLMKMQRLDELIIDGNMNRNRATINNRLDDDYIPFSVFNPPFDALVSELLSSGRLAIDELHINHVLFQSQSLTIQTLTTKNDIDIHKLFVSKCHVENAMNTNANDGLRIKNVLIRNDTPYSSTYSAFKTSHPLVLPLAHCEALMLNWTVLKNEYKVDEEIALSNLSKLHEFCIKFHESSAMDVFTSYVDRMKIGKDLRKLFLCINDYFNTFENDITHSVGIMDRFLSALFGAKKETKADQVRLEFRRASWEFVEVAVANIVRKCTDAVDKFELFYYEPKYKKYKQKKNKHEKRKILSQRDRRLNAMTNIFNAIHETLKDASYVYIKVSYTEEFDEPQMNEFEKDYQCLTEEIDDDEYIYEFTRRSKDLNTIKPTYTFDIYDFETYYEP